MFIIPTVIFTMFLTAFAYLLYINVKINKKKAHLERIRERLKDPRIIYESFETSLKMTE